MDSLFEQVPGFDQPIAVLKHCHDRIRKQLKTLERLLPHLGACGADVEAKQASTSIMRYFNNAAGKHHEDEEHDLLPMLKATATGEDAALLERLTPEILREHREMEAAWQSLERQLEAIAAGASDDLSAEEVKRFSDMYAAHMVTEETHIAPMAKRIFSSEQMARLGEAMRARRGISQ